MASNGGGGGGLSRRRVVNASSNLSLDDSSTNANLNGGGSGAAGAGSPSGSTLSFAHTPTTPSHATSNHNMNSHAGTAFEGGTKIAFDPRDVEMEAEELKKGGKMPKLTIMEEVLLLGLKDRQGYLSFWNDNISYALRGCILMELALRRRISIVKDPARRRQPLTERSVQVIDDRQTGETILDETLKMIKAQEGERMGVNSWVDLLSGETWNVMKIGFQLKQVRERLAKGLVDKGVLRTEKRNFLLFDMATHPVADTRTKESIVTRCVSLLTSTTSALPEQALGKEGENCRVTRSMILVCSAYAASVLENAFGRLGFEEKESALQRCDDILAEFSCWPFGSFSGLNGSASSSRKREGNRIGTGGHGLNGREAVVGLLSRVKGEMQTTGLGVGDGEDLCFELIAAVLEVLSKLDSLI